MASRSLKARSCGRSRRRQDCHYDVVWVLSVGAPVRTRRGPRCRSHTHQILCVRIMPTKSYVPARNVFLYNFIFHKFGALPDMRDDGDADDLVELLEACAQIDKTSSRTATTMNLRCCCALLAPAPITDVNPVRPRSHWRLPVSGSAWRRTPNPNLVGGGQRLCNCSRCYPIAAPIMIPGWRRSRQQSAGWSPQPRCARRSPTDRAHAAPGCAHTQRAQIPTKLSSTRVRRTAWF